MSKRGALVIVPLAVAAALALKRAREEAEYRRVVQARLDKYVGQKR
jgi:hypothetical protein